MLSLIELETVKKIWTKLNKTSKMQRTTNDMFLKCTIPGH